MAEGIRITEGGDIRITEAGDTRVTEGYTDPLAAGLEATLAPTTSVSLVVVATKGVQVNTLAPVMGSSASQSSVQGGLNTNLGVVSHSAITSLSVSADLDKILATPYLVTTQSIADVDTGLDDTGSTVEALVLIQALSLAGLADVTSESDLTAPISGRVVLTLIPATAPISGKSEVQLANTTLSAHISMPLGAYTQVNLHNVTVPRTMGGSIKLEDSGVISGSGVLVGMSFGLNGTVNLDNVMILATATNHVPASTGMVRDDLSQIKSEATTDDDLLEDINTNYRYTSNFVIVKGPAVIANEIYNILTTIPAGRNGFNGERHFEPEFGAGLSGFLFDPVDEVTSADILSVTDSAINRWLPHVVMNRRESYVYLTDYGFDVLLSYFVRANPNLQGGLSASFSRNQNLQAA